MKRIVVSGKFELDRRDYGITWSRALDTGGLFVGNEVAVEISVEAYIPKPAG